MKEIFEMIKEHVAYCKSRQLMFSLPADAKPYVTEHVEKDVFRDSWRLEKDGQWLTIEYSSIDKSKPFEYHPDRSTIVVKGSIPDEVCFSDAWDERA